MQWHLPFSRQHYEQLCRVMEGIATISNNFPAELFEPKKYPSQLPETEKHVMLRMAARAEPSSVKVAAGRIETVNAHVLPALQQTLVLKAYSRSTIKVYTNEIAQFLYAAKNHPVDDFSIDWRFR